MFVVKECSKCKEYKLLDGFYNVSSGPFGKCSRCKSCSNSYNKKYKDAYRKTDKFKEYNRNYDKRKRACNYIYKLRSNISRLIRYNLNAKTNRTNEILGCSFEEFKIYIERQFKKGMSWDNYGEWHLDHIYPVSLAKDEQHLIELNHYTNFQPLWSKENLSKGNKIIQPIQTKLTI